MFVHYLKLAWRNLLKYRTQNIISIVGLAVGILSFSVCFYVSRLMLDIDECFENHDRIAVVVSHQTVHDMDMDTGSYQIAESIRENGFVGIDACCFVPYVEYRDFMVPSQDGERLPYKLNFIETDTSFNQVFTPEIIAGSWYAASVTDNSVIMTESCAVRMFGNASKAVGKSIVTTDRLPYSPRNIPVNGGIVYTVEAVMKDLPWNNSLTYMVPMDIITLNAIDGYTASYKNVGRNIMGYNYVLLSQGSDADEANALLEGWRMPDDFFKDYEFKLVEWSEISKGSLMTVALITGLLGLLVLLVGFINFFHFLIGSFINRMKEFSIMKLYGNDTGKLFMLLFTEGLMMVLIASFLVLWMIEIFMKDLTLGIDAFLRITFSTKDLYFHVAEYIVLTILLCAAVSWFVALRIGRISVQNGIFGGEDRRGKQRGRNIMLAFQFVICWVFVIGTASLYMQAEETNTQIFHTLSKKEKENIFSVPLDYTFMEHEDIMLMAKRFGQHAGVRDMILADISYLDGSSGGGFFKEPDRTMESYAMLDLQSVPRNFFEFMNIELEQGRGLQVDGDLIVDRKWQKAQGGNVIGMALYEDTTYTVCGICEPFNTRARRMGDGRGTAFEFKDTDFSNYVGHCYVKCHEGQKDEVRKWIEGIRKEMLPPNISPEIITLAEDIREHQPLGYLLMKIIFSFSVVSLILTLLGVYSSITLDTESRRKEMAIRKINGADVCQIALIFCRLYVILLGVTAAVVFPVGYYVLGLVRQNYTVFFNYGPLFWLGVFAIVAALTFVTIIFRIRGIARENPAEVLKRE